MEEIPIEYVKMSPFEVACYDVHRRTIVIDEKLRGNKFLSHIIDHEMQHANSKGAVDIKIEMKDRKPPGFLMDMFRMKPLSVFNFIVPFIWYTSNGKFEGGWDGTRVLSFIMIFGGISVLWWWWSSKLIYLPWG